MSDGMISKAKAGGPQPFKKKSFFFKVQPPTPSPRPRRLSDPQGDESASLMLAK